MLEALAAGIPTACSSIPPLREVAGDAAIQFSPNDDEDMLRAIRLLASDSGLRQQLVHEGRERASHFSWNRAAEETLHVLQSAAARKQ